MVQGQTGQIVHKVPISANTVVCTCGKKKCRDKEIENIRKK
jgi:hypothetical protein